MCLPMHQHAVKAAEAAHCARGPGQILGVSRLAFFDEQLEIAQLKADARKLNLDGDSFDKCLDSGAQSAVVQEHASEGQALQIQGTPSFLINGLFFSGGFNYDQLKSVIDGELNNWSSQLAQSAKR